MDDAALKNLIERVAAETRDHATAVGAETRDHATAVGVETRDHATAVGVETRRHFDVTAERLEKKIEIVAEGVRHLDQKLDREAADIRLEMRTGFSETQAMIKFSHAELDRRVRALEDGFTNLQTRVDRLEASSH